MKKKILVLYLGQTGSGPLDALGVIKGLYKTGKWEITSITSVYNNNSAYSEYSENINYKTHKPKILSLLFHTLTFYKIISITKRIKKINPEFLLMPMFHPWMPIILILLGKTRHKVKFAMIIHNQQEMLSFSGIIKNFVQKFLENILIKQSEILLTFSKAVKIQFLKYNQLLAHQEIHNITFGAYIDLCPNFVHKRYNKTSTVNKKIQFLFFGRIIHYKGLDLLAVAWSRLQNEFSHVELTIAGSGKINKPTLTQFNNESVQILNTYISDEKLCQILEKTDVMVIPYRIASQSGPANIAIACCIPAIATNVGALPEQIIHNKNGIIVEPDAESIYSAMKKIILNPKKLKHYHEYAKHLRGNVINWEQTGIQLDKIFS